MQVTVTYDKTGSNAVTDGMSARFKAQKWVARSRPIAGGVLRAVSFISRLHIQASRGDTAAQVCADAETDKSKAQGSLFTRSTLPHPIDRRFDAQFSARDVAVSTANHRQLLTAPNSPSKRPGVTE